MTETAPIPDPGPDTAAARAVVVGVDGSAGNRAAVAWAAREALATGGPLILVAVLDDTAFLAPMKDPDVDSVRARQVLTEVSAQTRRDHPQLRVSHEMRAGGAVTTLLDRSTGHPALVVGKRGLGTFGRMMLGSTSTAVAGRSRVPVVVVPEGWDPESRTEAPIVVGADPDQEMDRSLRWAFEHADRLRVPVVVVHSTHLPRSIAWDPQAEVMQGRHEWLRRRGDDVRTGLELVRRDFPEVDASLVEDEAHPADLLLDRSEHAQLLVLGRREPGTFGFTLGSVARGVLHHATVPVAVIPS